MYFEFEKKDDMASYLSLSSLAMENIFLNDSTSLPFVVFFQNFQKVKFLVKQINEQLTTFISNSNAKKSKIY